MTAADNLARVGSLLQAFGSGDRASIEAGLAPDIQWHISGHDSMSGTRVGPTEVIEHLLGEADHVEDFSMELIDLLASEQRVAIIGRTTGRRGDRHMVNDFVNVVLLRDGLIAEVWQYHWDQAGIAAFLAATA